MGDVRGAGMMIGLDIVDNGASKRQAPAAAKWIREAMKARHVLLSTDGPFNSILKIKPPLCFGFREADHLLRELRPVRNLRMLPVLFSSNGSPEYVHEHFCT